MSTSFFLPMISWPVAHRSLFDTHPGDIHRHHVQAMAALWVVEIKSRLLEGVAQLGQRRTGAGTESSEPFH